MYRKRDRSQEQSRFLFLYGGGMQSAGFVDGVWYGSGAVRGGDVPMPAVVAALVCGGGTGNAMVAPSPMPAVDKTKGPASV